MNHWFHLCSEEEMRKLESEMQRHLDLKLLAQVLWERSLRSVAKGGNV